MHFMLHHLRWALMAGYPNKLEDKSVSWWVYDDYYRFLKDATLKLGDETWQLKDVIVYKDFAPCPLGREIDLVYDHAIDTVMTQAYLFLSDRLSMGNSLEVRSPLLDYKLFEHVMSLPLEYKYVKDYPKQYLKDVLAGIVPDYILYAKKRGFSSPPNFIAHVVQSYQYNCFSSEYKFYNSILADKLLSDLWKRR